MRITVHGHRPVCLRPAAREQAASQAPGAPGQAPSASAHASGGGSLGTVADMADAPAGGAPATESTVHNIHLGFIKLKVHRQTARQASLLAQVANTADRAGAATTATTQAAPATRPNPLRLVDSAGVRSATVGSDAATWLAARRAEALASARAESPAQPAAVPEPAAAPMAAPAEPTLTNVGKLDGVRAELFANDYIQEGLRHLPPGANVLVLSDGHESKSAGSLALDYSHLNIYSTDVDFPDDIEDVDMFGIGYKRVKVDNTKPFSDSVLGASGAKFGAVLMLKGLCDHNEWHDTDGNDAGPVGCGGVQLTPPGISALLAGIRSVLSENGRFALHGDINFLDGMAEHPALGPDVQREIIAGVELFNRACGEAVASVNVGDSGLVITGESVGELTAEQLARLKKLGDDYFAKDRTVHSVS